MQPRSSEDTSRVGDATEAALCRGGEVGGSWDPMEACGSAFSLCEAHPPHPSTAVPWPVYACVHMCVCV